MKFSILTRDGKLGPMSAAEAPKAGLDDTTLIQIEGEDRWLPLGCHDELFAALCTPRTRGAMHWGDFKRDGITKPGFRQYSSILWDIPWNQSWEDSCHAMPATINGMYFAHPDRCNNVGMMWGEFDVPESPNAIVFIAKRLVGGLGHIGWGYCQSGDNYVYGSKEIVYDPNNPGGSIIVMPGHDNKMFDKQGSFEDMLNDMRHGGSGGQHPYFAYDYYKHLQVPDAKPDAAYQKAKDAYNDGYSLLGNNCMNNAFNVLRAYGAQNEVMGDPTFNPQNWTPVVWFASLKADEVKL
jgi:hypothetical protein